MIIPATKDNINLAKKALLNGELIIYPTDTLYSFGALASDSKTINLINQIKKRQSPLSIIVSDIKQIDFYGYIKGAMTVGSKWPYRMPVSVKSGAGANPIRPTTLDFLVLAASIISHPPMLLPINI